MNVLLSNKFYYPRGGDCIYTLNLEQLLKDNGHEVAIFSMQHTENLPSQWEKYFPTEIKFSGGGLGSKLKAMLRPLYSREVSLKFRQLLRDFKPDVVHVNNIHSYLSPIIVKIAHQQGIPVVWTLHDYKLACPASAFLREGKICTACITSPVSVVKYKCHKKSLLASLLVYFEARYWHIKKLNRMVSLFISPSGFLKKKMEEKGIDSGKIIRLHNFTSQEGKAKNIEINRESSYTYLGRLSDEKGVKNLLEVAKTLPIYTLNVIGGGPLLEELKNTYKSFPHIIFHGHQNKTEINNLLGKSKFMVIPSEWYDNNPLVILESLTLGTPVLGARIGGIPELIDSSNGMLFESRNTQELHDSIEEMMNKQFDYAYIQKTATEKYSPTLYLNTLIELYTNCIENVGK